MTNGMTNGTARVIREAPLYRSASDSSDPASSIPGMPPNLGRFVLPQVQTISGLAASISRVYRPSDEALQHSYGNARFMRNDVGIMECVEARQRSVALLDWHLEPEDSNNQDQKELCSVLEGMLRRIPQFLKYRENLLHAIWYGRYAVQHRYQWVSVNGQMRALPIRWMPIHGDKLVFRVEDDPLRDMDEVGIRVGIGFKPGDRINNGFNKVEVTESGLAYFLEPWERRLIALHKHQIEDGDYHTPWDAGKIHGVGVRSKIYWDWFQKQELLGFLMEYLERAAFGIELWYYPWGNAEAKADAERAAKNRTANGRSVVLVPRPLGEDGQAYGVEHIEPGLGGVESLKQILAEYYGHRIKRYILGQTLTSEADATGLGSGVAEIHMGTFLDIVRYDATNLEETLTSDLVQPLKEWNFPNAKGVHVRFCIDTESQDSKAKMDAFQAAWNIGARIKEADVLALVGAGEPTENDRVLSSPSAAPMMPGAPGAVPGMVPGAPGIPGVGNDPNADTDTGAEAGADIEANAGQPDQLGALAAT